MNIAKSKTIALASIWLTFIPSTVFAKEVSTINPLSNLSIEQGVFKKQTSVFDIKKKKKTHQNNSSVITGRIQIPSIEARWSKDHRLGVEALRRHQFDKAEALLIKAIQEAKRKLSRRDELVETRLVLARLYLKQDRFQEAFQLYSQNLSRINAQFPADSKEIAETETGISRCLVDFGKEKQALVHVKKAIKILEKRNNTDSQEYGYALESLALIQANNAWYEDAKPIFEMALNIFEKEPGYNNLDLAQILREQALFYHTRGNRSKSLDLYERYYSINEQVVAADKPSSNSGQVRFIWEAGSPRAKEIIDTEFPFRYLSAGDVRIAATVIDLWELLAVLITVTNVGDHQNEFELGKVSLYELNRSGGKTFRNEVKPVDPKSIDRIRRERVMWDLTHTRPWLANIQKTRTVRGLVPANGHDLFRGPNVFGVYGDWKAISHIVPARVGIMASREGLHSSSTGPTISLPGMLRGGGEAVKDHVPVFLEPFESRTGDLFYLNPRDKDVLLRIPVGNASFEIPFHTRKQKIP